MPSLDQLFRDHRGRKAGKISFIKFTKSEQLWDYLVDVVCTGVEPSGCDLPISLVYQSFRKDSESEQEACNDEC